MVKLSDILIANQDLERFSDLELAIQAIARRGERFFRIDVRPPFPDTPHHWEDRLEAVFSGLVR
ncbi:MAG: sulfur relay protein DsrC [Pseudomonadota bacterium]